MRAMGKKVLITGGLGFIFSHVTEYFVKKKYDVVVIDNCTIGSHPEIVDGSFVFHKEDVTKERILAEQPDYIIHAAAITDVDYSIKHPYETLANNIFAKLHAFEAARELPHLIKFLYVNSDEVYGECEYPKKEHEIIFPRNPYSASKAIGSLIRYSYDNTYPTMKNKTAEIRMCNIFGERQDARKIMPQIIKALREGYSIPLQNDGEGHREYLYVKNVPPVIEKVLLEGDRVYNITNREGFTVNQLIAKAEALTGKKIKTHSAGRPGHDRWYRMDNTRIRELGWKPEYSFEVGFKNYILNA